MERTLKSLRITSDMFSQKLAVLALVCVMVGGCTTTKTLLVSSDPPQAFLKVNGDNIGDAPQTVEMDFSRIPSYAVTATKVGYLPETVRLEEKDPRLDNGSLTMSLEEDEAYRTTTTSEAANRWLRVQVAGDIDKESAWQRIVDSVTTAYDSLEQMDATAGYIRSTGKVRRYQRGPGGPFRIRTAFLGSISSDDPLVYKFKLRSETRLERQSEHDWQDYGRVFREDAQLVEELTQRLGLR